MQKPIQKFHKGVLHCLDGPAVEHLDGTKEWWVNGERHRTDGPAIEYLDGTCMYWLNGKLHRLDGPAIDMHVVKSWWHNGICLNTIYFIEKKKIPGESYLKFGIR